MSVSLTYASNVTVSEVLTGNTDSLTEAKRTVTHDQFNTAASLSSTSTPPVTKVANFVQALSGGTATIDLTSLTGTNGASVDGSGLKVQAFKMKNLGANTMSITFGAANPYNLAGADFKVNLLTNQEWTFYGNDATPDVAGGAKDMDLAGTTTQTCEISIVMG